MVDWQKRLIQYVPVTPGMGWKRRLKIVFRFLGRKIIFTTLAIIIVVSSWLSAIAGWGFGAVIAQWAIGTGVVFLLLAG